MIWREKQKQQHKKKMTTIKFKKIIFIWLIHLAFEHGTLKINTLKCPGYFLPLLVLSY